MEENKIKEFEPKIIAFSFSFFNAIFNSISRKKSIFYDGLAKKNWEKKNQPTIRRDKNDRRNI